MELGTDIKSGEVTSSNLLPKRQIPNITARGGTSTTHPQHATCKGSSTLGRSCPHSLSASPTCIQRAGLPSSSQKDTVCEGAVGLGHLSARCGPQPPGPRRTLLRSLGSVGVGSCAYFQAGSFFQANNLTQQRALSEQVSSPWEGLSLW